METHTNGDETPSITNKLRNLDIQRNEAAQNGSASHFVKSEGDRPAPALNGHGDGEEAVWREVLELGHSRQAESTQVRP